MSIVILICLYACNEKKEKVEEPIGLSKEEQQQIIDETLQSAYQYHLYSQEFQEEMNKGLAKDSTLAYLWQQKAMPLYKLGKYELGRPFLDKAVQHNRQSYLDYRAFMICIFTKNYEEAIVEFQKCIDEYGNSYVMDHTYKFYMGVSYLMLKDFEKAEAIFSEDISAIKNENGEDWVHHLELFYYGISLYEQQKFDEAIAAFDRALAKYPNFSDVQYYQALAFAGANQIEKSEALMKEAEKNTRLGNTINEDNVIYEKYPYQVGLNMYKTNDSK